MNDLNIFDFTTFANTTTSDSNSNDKTDQT